MIHVITGEYPPTSGGVGAYTAQLARAFIDQGHAVHVWTGGTSGLQQEDGISVHRTAGQFRPLQLVALSRHINRIPGPRRILVQWTPHSYGMRSLNLAFPAWLWRRSVTTTDRIELIVHEAFLGFGEGNWRHNAAAAVQRAMAFALLRAASKVWITIPKWQDKLRPWTFGKHLPFEWLPVPSNIPAGANIAAIVELRRRLTCGRSSLIGHFGTFRRDIESLLFQALMELCVSTNPIFLLIGRGSHEARRRMVDACPDLTRRIFATGELEPADVADHLSACDLLLQPYPDGISTRRGSAMAALSLGIPVVTNFGPLTESFWDSTGALAIAADSSADALTLETIRVLTNPACRIQMSAAARTLYQQRFHIRHTIAALLATPIRGAAAKATA